MILSNNAYNTDLRNQMNLLIEIVTKNAVVYDVLDHSSSILNTSNYYIGAGCITQSVWNHLSGFQLDYGIKDIDLVYFDNTDLSIEGEDRNIKKVLNEFMSSTINIDVKNQARVHLWYKEHFGYEIQPYHSLEEAINTWPTTSTAIGIRKIGDQWDVYAPYGLNDLFGKIVRANKVQITKEIYEKKIKQWRSLWTDLRIVSWE